MTGTIGTLVKVSATDTQDALTDGFLQLCNGHTPQDCTTAFVCAIISLIDHAVKPGAREGAAKGIAAAILANFACEDGVNTDERGAVS